MKRFAALCTSLLLSVACASAVDESESSQDQSEELRAPGASSDIPTGDESTSRAPGSVNGPSLDAKVSQRGKPQPQPWRSGDPLPPTNPNPTPAPGSGESSSGSETGK